MRAITDDEVESYQRDGVVCLRGLIQSDWIELLQEAAERSLGKPGKLHAELAKERKQTGRFFHDTFVWMHDDTCRRFVQESPAAEVAAGLMQSSKLNIFFDQWLIKEPGTETRTPWHHDLPYWPIDGSQVCTLWLALDPVRDESGAVAYVKGSHRWGKRFRPASFSGGNQYTENLPEVPDIDAMRDELEFISFDLEPGDCTVHHGLLLHGSSGNRSLEHRRRAHVSRWVGDDVVYRPREGLQEMPPVPPLNDGDPLDSDLWPRVFG